MVDQGTEQAFADGQVPDSLGDHRGDTDVDELGQAAVGGEHAQRRVAGADEVAGGDGDAVQHVGQGQPAVDHLVGAQQAAQPALGGHHLLGPLHQLGQKLVQLQPW